MYSAIFRLLLGALGVAGSLKIYSSLKKNKKEQGQVNNLLLFFVFLTLHQFALASAYFFVNNSLGALTVFQIAILFYFFMLFFAVKILFNIFSAFKFLRYWMVRVMVISLGFASIALNFFNWQNPKILNGFIIWQLNPLSAWFIGLAGFLTGFIWAFMFYKYMPKENKTKTLLLVFGAIFLGLSCLVFFTGMTPACSIVTYFLIILGLSLAIISFFSGEENSYGKGL